MADSVLTFTCPVCTRTSANPHDIAEGYCGNCHDWTGGQVFLANRLTDLLEGLFEDGVMRESGVTLLVTMEGMEFRIAVTKTGVETVTRAATAQEKARAALRQYLHLSSDSAEQTRARVEELLDLAGL